LLLSGLLSFAFSFTFFFKCHLNVERPNPNAHYARCSANWDSPLSNDFPLFSPFHPRVRALSKGFNFFPPHLSLENFSFSFPSDGRRGAEVYYAHRCLARPKTIWPTEDLCTKFPAEKPPHSHATQAPLTWTWTRIWILVWRWTWPEVEWNRRRWEVGSGRRSRDRGTPTCDCDLQEL